MADEKSRGRRRISIDGAGIERRRTAIQTLVDQAPQPRADQVAQPRADQVAAPVSVAGAGPDDVESPRSPVQDG